MEEQNKLEIPDVVYQGDDRRLKERVFQFRRGSLRIAVFTLVGFIMGAYSHNYTGIGFFPVKLIMAIPYKISEAIYVSIIGTDGAGLSAALSGQWYLTFTEFFPHSVIATFLAENFTAVLVGGALYGSLAYFTGDRRVFTLQRFTEFAAIWCGMILIAVGSAYLVNARAVYDNERLRGEPRMYLHTSDGRGSRISGGEGDGLLTEYLYSELEPREVVRDRDRETVVLTIEFNGLRVHNYRVNHEAQYLVTEQGRVYYISEDFAQVIRRIDEGESVQGVIESENAESMEILSPEKEESGNTGGAGQ